MAFQEIRGMFCGSIETYRGKSSHELRSNVRVIIVVKYGTKADFAFWVETLHATYPAFGLPDLSGAEVSFHPSTLIFSKVFVAWMLTAIA